MSFNKINNITGWIVCLIACTVYILTAEAGGSLWDCGEFVSSAFKLQIPHPPGAPLFVLIGRFFIILFGDNNLTAAKAVNIMSALASGFTILFLFWTITHFGRKIITRGKNMLLPGGITTTSSAAVSENLSELSMGQTLSIMGAGAVGALAYTFSDSFWYSAVEGEVYALSSFFTALVFWAILKWEYAADKDDTLKAAGRPSIFPDRWLIFIFFMMGLSIGVHLLNLLCIPAIVMVYYFKRFKTTAWGTIWAFVVGCIVTGFVQKVVIQYTINGAGYADIWFVNSFGLPFFSGFAVYFIVMAAIIAIGLRFKATNYNKGAFTGWFIALSLLLFIPMIVKADGGGKFLGLILAVGLGFLGGYFVKPGGFRTLKLALWSFTFMLIGYSSYITTMIRSNANPAVDMYNVDNPMSLVGYLGREQYGDFPLLYGQKFTAQPYESKEGATKYQKAGNKYIENGKEFSYVYQPEDMMLFPRVWDASNDQGHADYYAQYLGIDKTQDGYERPPNFADNVKWYVGYQNYFMYIRYFLWNFSGKQNDVQGSGAGNVRDGNWITGISFIDNILYGDQGKLPNTVGKDNKAHNKLFALPFILGLIGMFYHYNRHKKDFLINFLLFFFTGFAIVVYLNQAGNQPRERDYAYVGSFYAFAVWIGLGVLYLIDLAFRWDKKMVMESVAIGGVLSFLVFAGSLIGLGAGPAFALGICIYILYLLVGLALPYVLRFLSNYKSIVGAAILIGLFIPAVMASQEWDDHDRSHKELARDLARDYLESCAPNAILFSFGDNDTYPLWYAQEVEKIRPDVRVINYSLMGIDWYINQFRYKVNNSDPIDVIFTPAQLEGRNRDYIRFQQNGDQTGYRDLKDVIQNWIASDDPGKMTGQGGDAEMLNTFPTHRFSLPVNTQQVHADGTVGPKDTSILPIVNFEVTRNILMKNDLAVLGIIAANNWKRPVYFTSPSSEGLGLDPYLRRDGMAYRLVPIANGDVNPDWMFDKLMNKFTSGNANIPNVYFDEENRRHLNNIRQSYADLANYLGTNNRKDSGRQVLGKMDKLMLQSNMPYGMTSRYSMQDRTSLMCLEAAYRNEDKAMIEKISASVKSDLNQQMDYYASLGNMSRAELENILNQTNQMNQTNRGSGDAYLQSMLQGKQQGMGGYEISQAYNLLMTMNQMQQMYNQAPARVEMPQRQQAKPINKTDGTSAHDTVTDK